MFYAAFGALFGAMYYYLWDASITLVAAGGYYSPFPQGLAHKFNLMFIKTMLASIKFAV